MDKFCKNCGAQHTASTYPKKCEACGFETWFNPSPVAALLVPVWHPERDRLGVLIGRRLIPPQIGAWNLIAGYVDASDKSLEETMRREFWEETGIRFDFEPQDIVLKSSFGDGRVMLTFGVCQKRMPYSYLDQFIANSECDAVDVAWEPQELCFSSHTAALAAFFKD